MLKMEAELEEIRLNSRIPKDVARRVIASIDSKVLDFSRFDKMLIMSPSNSI